jgi:type IV pilus assembly protein PilA
MSMIARIHKAMAKKDQGFTLIELLVVVIIIGILAAIAIPVFLNQRKSAVDAGVKSDIRAVANEVETFYVNNQKYPESIDASAEGEVTIGDNTIQLSNDANTIVYELGDASDTYVITGENETAGTGNKYQYVSNEGGLQDEPVEDAPAAPGAGG